MNREKVIIYGVGKNYQSSKLAIFSRYDVVAIADRRVGMTIDGFTTISMDEIRSFSYDKIIITPLGNARQEIYEQIRDVAEPENIIELEFNNDFFRKKSAMMIDSRLFKKNASFEEKKILFRNNIQMVYIELSSFCNRQCWFCPNKFIDRHSQNILISDKVILDIISQLKSIDYSNTLLLTLNNEPLADNELERKIALFKQALPKCKIQIFTNGDFLSKERLESLAQAGLDNLTVSVYIDHHNSNENHIIPFHYDDAKSAINTLHNKLSLQHILFFNEQDSKAVYAYSRYKQMDIILHSRNLCESIYSRGGLITNVKLKQTQSQPCIYPYHAFIIDNQCNVPLCNNVRVEHELHKDCIIGNVKDDSIFDIYVDGFKAWRTKLLADIDYVEKPCCECYFQAQVLSGLLY